MRHLIGRLLNSCVLEAMEGRLVASAVAPTDIETYMLELINRARANPAAEAARDGIDLNEGLAPGTLTTDAKPPLALNAFMNDSADQHSNWMLLNSTFAHEEVAATPGYYGVEVEDRLATAGYSGQERWGENIAWRGTTGAFDVADYALTEHNDLFIDTTEEDRGHRINILDEHYREIGVGMLTGPYTVEDVVYNSLMTTTDFAAKNNSTYFLTGVVYDDSLVTADHFYTPGEGLANVTITATRVSDSAVFHVTDFDSGAYTLALTPGTYNISTSGGNLGGTFVRNGVVIGNENVKVDITPDAVSHPVMAVVGNGLAIAQGEAAPAIADGTNFGIVTKNAPGVLSQFVIRNDGPVPLNLSTITVPSGFSASNVTGISVGSGETFTLNVTMTTGTAGTHAGTITLPTNDPTANPFRFDVYGFVTEPFVAHLYVDLLRRSADTNGLMYWTNVLASGTSSEQVVSSIVNLTEYRTLIIQDLYTGILGRRADDSGLQAWLGFFAGGGTVEEMESGFYGSQEYLNANGGSIDGVVNAFYRAFLGRDADTAGLAYWHDQIANHNLARDSAALSVLKSLEGRHLVVQRLYRQYLLREVDPVGLDYWTAQLGSGLSETSIIIHFLGSTEYFNRAS